MAVKSKSDIKSTLEAGDRPTQADFGDFVDSYVPIASDGAVGFMEVISTASSIARPAETLVAIATAVQGGKTGVIEVLATADVTALTAGAVGRELLSAIVTASAQDHIGLVPGAAGLEIFEAVTTASAQGHLDGGTVGIQIFTAETTASAQGHLAVVDTFATQLLHVRDEKSTGTDGGTFTSGAWRTRDLQTTPTNEITGASVSSDQIILPAGTYYIEAISPAFEVAGFKTRLENITDTATLLVGTPERHGTAGDVATTSHLCGRFTLAAQKTIELQAQCSTTNATDGFGRAAGFSVVEVYSDVQIWKVA